MLLLSVTRISVPARIQQSTQGQQDCGMNEDRPDPPSPANRMLAWRRSNSGVSSNRSKNLERSSVQVGEFLKGIVLPLHFVLAIWWLAACLPASLPASLHGLGRDVCMSLLLMLR